MDRKGHALVIGGTGMLRNVSLYLTKRGYFTSVVARTEVNLKELAKAAGAAMNPVQADYTNQDVLIVKLNEAIKRYGPIRLVVAWIHNIGATIPLRIAEIIENKKKPIHFFQIFGNDARDPKNANKTFYTQLTDVQGIRYHKVILSYKTEDGLMRWLTNDEIADGVIDAIKKKRKIYVVPQSDD